jgi:hypothetical protein
MATAPECSGAVYLCAHGCETGLMTSAQSWRHSEDHHPESITVKTRDYPDGIPLTEFRKIAPRVRP